VKPGIDHLDGDGIAFTDGSREAIDAIVWATDYNVESSFLQAEDVDPVNNRFPASNA